MSNSVALLVVVVKKRNPQAKTVEYKNMPKGICRVKTVFDYHLLLLFQRMLEVESYLYISCETVIMSSACDISDAHYGGTFSRRNEYEY